MPNGAWVNKTSLRVRMNEEQSPVGECPCNRGEDGVMGVVVFSCLCEGQPAGGVCVWARTDSPATLHSPAITAPTNNRTFKVVVG